MVRNDQHRQPIADMGREQIEQAIDFAFEPRRHVVDRGEKEAPGAALHGGAFAPRWRSAPAD
jgi:hypothetical protein